MSGPARPDELGADDDLLDRLGTRAALPPEDELVALLAGLAALADTPLVGPLPSRGQPPSRVRGRRGAALVAATGLALTGATASAAAVRLPPAPPVVSASPAPQATEVPDTPEPSTPLAGPWEPATTLDVLGQRAAQTRRSSRTARGAAPGAAAPDGSGTASSRHGSFPAPVVAAAPSADEPPTSPSAPLWKGPAAIGTVPAEDAGVAVPPTWSPRSSAGPSPTRPRPTKHGGLLAVPDEPRRGSAEPDRSSRRQVARHPNAARRTAAVPAGRAGHAAAGEHEQPRRIGK